MFMKLFFGRKPQQTSTIQETNRPALPYNLADLELKIRLIEEKLETSDRYCSNLFNRYKLVNWKKFITDKLRIEIEQAQMPPIPDANKEAPPQLPRDFSSPPPLPHIMTAQKSKKRAPNVKPQLQI